MFEHFTISVSSNALKINKYKTSCRGKKIIESSLQTPHGHYFQIHDQMKYMYKEETSKKIPHLDDVVCHAVQTETLHGSILAPKASQCKGGIVEQ